MIFSSFFEEFPELVESEFRNIFVLDNGVHKYIPPGNYAFLELFCPDLDCDCRKVIINIVSVNPTKAWAALNYAWEPEEYYKTWWGTSHEHYRQMSGVTCDPPTKNPLKNEFLAVFQDILKQDKNYAGRLEKHYVMFKERMRDKASKKSITKKFALNLSGEQVGRNDLCPCNSGNKFKKCCLLKAAH